MKNYLALFLLLSSFAAFGQNTCSEVYSENFNSNTSGGWSGGSRRNNNGINGSGSYRVRSNQIMTQEFDFSNPAIVGIEIDFWAKAENYDPGEGFKVELRASNSSSWIEIRALDQSQNGFITTITDERTYSSTTQIRIISDGNNNGDRVFIDEISIKTCSAPDNEKPSDPTNLAVSNITGSSADITWTASTDNVGVTGYNVYVGGTLDGSTTNTSYSLSGLSPAINYSVAVEAKDATGNTSSQVSTSFNTLSCTTIDSEDFEGQSFSGTIWNPRTDKAEVKSDSNFNSTPGGEYLVLMKESGTNMYTDQLDLSTYDNLTVEFNFELKDYASNHYFTLEISTSGGNSNSDYSEIARWTRSDYSNENPYRVSHTYSGSLTSVTRLRFRVGNSDKELYLDDIEINACQTSDTEAPTTPQNLSTTNITSSSFLVNWTASSDNEGVTGYNIFRDNTQVATSTTTSYSFTGLSAATSYDIEVQAYDAAGNTSAKSSVLAVTTLANFSDLLISSGKTLTIGSGTSLTTVDGTILGDVVVNSSASSSGSFIATGTVSSGTSSGNITYNRYIADTDWHIVSSPVEGQSFSAFASNNSNNSLATNGSLIAIGRYENSNAAGSRWEYYDTGNTGAFDTNFNSGKGYIIKRTSAGTITFVGDIAETTVQGNAVISLSSSTSNHLWYAVGNPWPAYIPGTASESNLSVLKKNEEILDTNYMGIYVWDGSQWSEKNFNDTVDLVPGQAFMVRLASNSAADFKFPKSHQKKKEDNTDDTFFKDEERTQINLFVSNEQRLASTRLFYNEIGTPAMDPGYDSGSFNIKRLDIKTRLSESTEDNANIDLGTQTLSNLNFEGQVIPIALHTEEREMVNISAEHINLPDLLEIYLEDRKEAQFYNLKKSSAQFVFENAQSEPGRFFLHTKQANFWEEEPEEEPVGAIPFDFHKLQGNVLYFEGITSNQQYRISLYNLAGYKVVETAAEINPSNYEVQLPSYLSKGVYVLRIQKPDGKIMTKKIIVD